MSRGVRINAALNDVRRWGRIRRDSMSPTI